MAILTPENANKTNLLEKICFETKKLCLCYVFINIIYEHFKESSSNLTEC